MHQKYFSIKNKCKLQSSLVFLPSLLLFLHLRLNPTFSISLHSSISFFLLFLQCKLTFCVSHYQYQYCSLLSFWKPDLFDGLLNLFKVDVFGFSEQCILVHLQHGHPVLAQLHHHHVWLDSSDRLWEEDEEQWVSKIRGRERVREFKKVRKRQKSNEQWRKKFEEKQINVENKEKIWNRKRGIPTSLQYR